MSTVWFAEGFLADCQETKDHWGKMSDCEGEKKSAGLTVNSPNVFFDEDSSDEAEWSATEVVEVNSPTGSLDQESSRKEEWSDVEGEFSSAEEELAPSGEGELSSVEGGLEMSDGEKKPAAVTKSSVLDAGSGTVTNSEQNIDVVVNPSAVGALTGTAGTAAKDDDANDDDEFGFVQNDEEFWEAAIAATIAAEVEAAARNTFHGQVPV
jgi:hypothetical protein